MANCNKRDLVAVGYIGKVKTTVQMIAITILIGVDASTPEIFTQLGIVLIYASAVFSLWSMISYLRAALPTLMMK
jgi:CDP-diacylglycerol--glycerol-3-phosphate 3-phosphatidyltransferase